MLRDTIGNSYLFGGNAPFVEELYELFLTNPSAVAEEWRNYFERLAHLPTEHGVDVPHQPVIASIGQRARQGKTADSASPREAAKQVAVMLLVNAFRMRGHRWANIDPLKRFGRPDIPELTLEFYGLTEADFLKKFIPGTFWMPQSPSTLREIYDAVRQTYCGTIGFDYNHITEASEKRWLQERVEPSRAQPQLSVNEKKRILDRLTAAETLEKYLHTKYVGQKRFSLEGGESLIVAMDELVQRSAKHGVQEVVIGMAHRGRLNVLINTLGKTPKELFSEFEGKKTTELSAGDVKYHQGFSSDYPTAHGSIHLTLAFNPSHLEIVNPVVEGSVRSRQDRRADKLGKEVLPILIHGDAAFAGQGVIQETLNLSQTRYYGTGGTVHLVVNNQIGFTTSDPRDARSTYYCTDIAKMLDVPIFHVNGDDPESVFMAIQIALDYRMHFHKDVVIDIVCYRRLGHNEQDEPMVTQPLMYKKIAQNPGTRALYAETLVSQGVIGKEEPEQYIKTYRAGLESGALEYNKVLTNFQRNFAVDWSIYNGVLTDHVDTSVPLDELKRLAERLVWLPKDFELHSRVQKIIADRTLMGQGELNLDWGMAENLAYASLLTSGFHIRISGQDCGRGTFFHRHAVLHDQKRSNWDEGAYIPLTHLQTQQGRFTVIDSVLSEEAVLGFEYGYSASSPDTLVIWEGQFGDFANGAQVVIDQFISSGEAKWGRLSGLTMMLPHGYEGQGPEHSSARIERYLQLCAGNNMQVCMPSLPSQMFHLLRRQMVRKARKPLIIITPKSLLRHKDSVSSLADLSKGGFREIIEEVDAKINPTKVRRVLACSGKLYFELMNERTQKKITDVAIIRVEQLYPFPKAKLQEAIKQYSKAQEVVWVQEEPKNQGMWYQMRHRLEQASGKLKLFYWGREASASPAVGYASKHAVQQKLVVEGAFTDACVQEKEAGIAG